MNRNLKIILVSSFLPGILAGILFSVMFGTMSGIISGILTGLATGTTLFLITGVLHKRLVGKITGDKSEGVLKTCHFRDSRLEETFDNTYDLCINSLEVIGNYCILEADLHAGRIIAKTGINWKTWGDIITFDLIREGEESTLVNISSRPASSTTLVDFGKNLDNVQRITSFLKKHG